MFGMTQIEGTQITTPEELDALPNFTVVVASHQFPNGNPAVLAAEKIDGAWHHVGHAQALTPYDFSADFFINLRVVFQL